LAFAPADRRKFYADRGWEPVELEEMSQTARQMNRAEPLCTYVVRLLPGAHTSEPPRTAPKVGRNDPSLRLGEEVQELLRRGDGELSTRAGLFGRNCANPRVR
jgi:hypothetical protein